MGHRKGDELLPVLGAGEPPRGFQLFVQGRRRKRGHQAKDRQPRRPSTNFLQSSLRYARRVIVHAKDKGGDGKNVALGEPIEHHGIFTRLVEALFYVSKVGRKADRIAKKSRHGAKLASVRTAAPGLHGNNSKGSPASAHSLE